MHRYIARRLMLYPPTLFLASIVIFAIMRVLPGDVAQLVLGGADSSMNFSEEQVQEVRDALGLNKSLVAQYGSWMKDIFTGSFGQSFTTDTSVADIIKQRFPVTLSLAVYTIFLSVIVSVPLGIIAALYQDKWPDYLVRVATIMGLAVPPFWTALLAILGLVLVFHWSPPMLYESLWHSPWEHVKLMIWPVLVLAWAYSSYLVRMTRSTLLEVLRQDYVRTASSKGLKRPTVIMRHAMPNVLIPVVTIAGVYLGSLLGGAVIMETIFGLPGLGREIIGSVSRRDYPVTQSLTLTFVFLALTMNLLVDLFYAFIDPRIRYD